MMLVVTEIGWDGRMRRRMFDFSGLSDARFWEDLIGQILQPGACQYATK